MRLTGSGLEVVGRRVVFTYDGETLHGVEGESLAAALTAAGRLALPQASGGPQRGMFCGMGICQGCLLTVNGEAGRRACMTALSADAVVQTNPMSARREAQPFGLASPRRDASPDLLVVGAGAAGLTAARAAADTGLDVMIVDERSSLGGQYYKQPSAAVRFGGPGRADKQFREGRRLIEAVESRPITILRNALLWGAFSADGLGVVANGESYVLRPKRTLLATGAFERAVPLPGWTLPGVMSTGAAQTLLRAHRVAPGRRVVVGGNGPLNLQVAAELVRSGVEVVALVEAARRAGVGMIGAAIRALRTAPDLIAAGMRDLALLRRRGVPVLGGFSVTRIDGEAAEKSVTLMRIDDRGLPISGSERRVSADAVCLGFGFLPQNELARGLGCRHRYDPRFDQLVVDRDAQGRTSVPNIFVAGDAGGFGGARIAVAQGAIAGYSVGRDLGRALSPAQENSLSRWQRDLDRQRRFQAALWEIYRAPVLTVQLAAPDTAICRCEGVTKAALSTAVEDGATTIGQLKRNTRAGMGPCQGRYCGPVMAQMIAACTGQPVDENSYFAPRSPAKPISIAAIAEPVEG